MTVGKQVNDELVHNNCVCMLIKIMISCSVYYYHCVLVFTRFNESVQ